MTKTLTTKALRALRDSLKSWQDGYDPVDDKEQYEMFVTAETAVGELLANREAQPVVVMYKDGSVLTKEECGNVFDICCKVETPLFTAPPAPAVTRDLLEAMTEVIRISDRDHEAWDRAKASISAYRRTMFEFVSGDYKFNNSTIPYGWKLVPVELTSEMMAAWDSAPSNHEDDAVNMANGYRAMLAAAPEGGN